MMQGTMPGACRRERPRTAWVDNINMWAGFCEKVNQNEIGQR